MKKIKYTIPHFFNEFKEVKITAIAKNAEVNGSLLRQYATGRRYSKEQAKKVEDAIHRLAERIKHW